MTRQIFFRDLRVFLFAFFAVKTFASEAPKWPPQTKLDLHKKQVFRVFQIASRVRGWYKPIAHENPSPGGFVAAFCSPCLRRR